VPSPSPPVATSSPTPAPPSGGRTVTLTDDGSTINLAVGDRFLLNLGAAFDWSLTIADPSVVARVPNISVIAGAQGVFEAKAPGRTTLAATGDPPCRKSTPPCAAPSRAFRVEIVVG
jgi:hypothetical protein